MLALYYLYFWEEYFKKTKLKEIMKKKLLTDDTYNNWRNDFNNSAMHLFKPNSKFI